MDKAGKWKCEINHALYRGDAYAIIKKGDPYDISLEIDSPYFPRVKFVQITDTENTMDVVAKVDVIPMNIKAHVDFKGDCFSGTLKIPFIGDIALENGYKVEDKE